MPDRRHRHARKRGLHLHPRRVRVRGVRAREGDRAGVREGLPGQERLRHRSRFRCALAPRRWRVHLRGRDGAHRIARGQARQAPPQAALPGKRGPLRLPDHGCQRGDGLCGADDHAARPRLVLVLRAEEQCGHKAVLHLWPRQQPLHGRGGDVDPAQGAAAEALQGRGWGVGQPAGRHSGRLVGTDPDVGHLRRGAHGLRRPEERPLGPRHRRRHRLQQADRHRRRHRTPLQVLRARVMRPVHALPRGDWLDAQDHGPACDGRRGDQGD
mmetsp:Transcript_3882/g.13083  ORF Transcript_3882/g.13083 Transcript_3882/m.13083 type:complete len:269 (-) Transcript_3882:508-1314(-)